MTSALKIVHNIPTTVEDLSTVLTDINHGTVVASWVDNVLRVDFCNWQGYLFVRRNPKGNLVYNLGREVVNYKAGPLTFARLTGGIDVLCIYPYPPNVDRHSVILDLSKVIHEFSLRNV